VQGVVGRLVVVEGREELGTGRIASSNGEMLLVEWFESIAQPVAHSEQVRPSACRPVRLGAQTRAYWRHDDRWFVGRIVWSDAQGYALRLPNSKQDVPVPAGEIYVRWNRPVADPMDVLVAGGAESPHFRDTRIPFFASLVAQRAAGGGLPALLSSAVELYPHQLRVAQQVLADPVQRYLLADEVGLGKTIEAGFVLRQYLLDHPDGTVLIIAPESLRRQWQQELRDKFFIEDFPRANIRISSHAAPEKWTGREAIGLTVVDEAHRLVEADAVYDALRLVCLRSERLLLLSATPVLHREQQMHRLLHLLDPEMYDLADVAEFTAKVRSRHEIAMAFFALDPDFPFTVTEHTRTIRQAFSTDERLQRLCSRVDLAAEKDDVSALRAGIEALRAHVNEAHRLHRRIIRQRRDAVVGREACGPDSPPFEVTGRQRPALLTLDDDVWAGRDALLESVRLGMLQDLQEAGSDSPPQTDLGRVLGRLLEASTDPLSGFEDLVRARLSGSALGPADGTSASAPGPGSHERRALKAGASTGGAAAEAVVQCLQPCLRAHDSIVIFAADAHSASTLTAALRKRLPEEVGAHYAGLEPEDMERDVQRWTAGQIKVLVADASAEEGRNLQSADAVVHLGLPIRVNRLEQRLGRVDRHGAPNPARQYLVVPEDPESYARTWARALVEGFGVFDRSLSALQYVLADLYAVQAQVLVDEGAGGLEAWRGGLAGILDARRRDLAAEDMLEASFLSEDSRRGFDRLDRLEANWQALERATDTLLAGAPGSLGFEKKAAGQGGGAVTYSPVAETLVPLDLLGRWAANAAFEAPTSFNRTAALRRAGVRVARSGSVLVDALERLVQHDDRGQASAVWRFRQGWRREEAVYFGLDYLIEADIAAALQVAPEAPDAARAIRRRVDQLLPPFLRRLWLPAFETDVVTDDLLLRLLDGRYAPGQGGDKNLSFERRGPLFDILNGPQGFVEACRSAREAGASAVRRLSDLDRRASEAEAAARTQFDRELGYLAARRNSALLVAAGDRSTLTPHLADALLVGVRNPKVRMTSVALVVLAPHGWRARSV
jgi:ATP-dependent helicase HepA